MSRKKTADTLRAASTLLINGIPVTEQGFNAAVDILNLRASMTIKDCVYRGLRPGTKDLLLGCTPWRTVDNSASLTDFQASNKPSCGVSTTTEYDKAAEAAAGSPMHGLKGLLSHGSSIGIVIGSSQPMHSAIPWTLIQHSTKNFVSNGTDMDNHIISDDHEEFNDDTVTDTGPECEITGIGTAVGPEKPKPVIDTSDIAFISLINAAGFMGLVPNFLHKGAVVNSRFIPRPVTIRRISWQEEECRDYYTSNGLDPDKFIVSLEQALEVEHVIRAAHQMMTPIDLTTAEGLALFDSLPKTIVLEQHADIDPCIQILMQLNRLFNAARRASKPFISMHGATLFPPIDDLEKREKKAVTAADDTQQTSNLSV